MRAMINQNAYYTRQKEFFNGGIVGNSRPLSTYMRIFQISHRDIKKLLNNTL